MVGGWGGGLKFWYHSPEEVLELSSAGGPVGNPQNWSPSARRQFASCRSCEASMTPQGQVPSLMNEEMKVQRGEETCPRSQSKWLQSWDWHPQFSLAQGSQLHAPSSEAGTGWEAGAHSLPGPAYLEMLPGSQPAPSLGAAPGGGSSLKRSPGGSTEGAFCWGCCSSSPLMTCSTHWGSLGAAEGPGRGDLQRRVRG